MLDRVQIDLKGFDELFQVGNKTNVRASQLKHDIHNEVD